jgi:hypothetical protein
MDAYNLLGFSYVLFAENYCSGVPVSTVNPDFTLSYGPAQTTQQLLDSALAQFDAVLATATASTGAAEPRPRRARPRAAEPGPLRRRGARRPRRCRWPSASRCSRQRTAARQNNGTWNLTTNQGRAGVSDVESGEGLPFVTAADPRVPSRPRSTNGGNGFDGGPMREQLKYPTRTSDATVADGVEAQLIRAEAALRAGNATTFLALLNELRANAALVTQRGGTGTLAALADPGTAAGRQDLLFAERAFWLYGTSHRLGDLRRLVRQYGRAASSVFPSGNYSSNGRTGAVRHGRELPDPRSPRGTTRSRRRPGRRRTPRSRGASTATPDARGAGRPRDRSHPATRRAPPRRRPARARWAARLRARTRPSARTGRHDARTVRPGAMEARRAAR